MNELLDRLEQWGADPVEAIHRMLDDEPFYRGLLEKFGKKKGWELFRAAIEENDYEKAFRFAHDIKGDAAVLELTPLYDAIEVVVEELREGEPGEAFLRNAEAFFREIETFQNIVSGAMRMH